MDESMDSRQLRSDIRYYWTELQTALSRLPLDLLDRAAEMLMECYERDATVFVAGNGGSAATASHFACDLSKGTRNADGRPFRCIPLTDNAPLLTAWANDTSFTHVFAEQLDTLARPYDLLVAISVSGTSPNIRAAVERARARALLVLSLTGSTGGSIGRLSDVCIKAPGTVEQVEDLHLMIGHTLCVALRNLLQRHAMGEAGVVRLAHLSEAEEKVTVGVAS